MALPTDSPTGPTTVLLIVRNITSWLCSMSRNGYELYPDPSVKRKQHAIWWLLRNVKLLAEEANYPNSLGTLLYSTAVDLWFDYIRGYLSGFLAPGSEPTRAVVVRQEDLLCRPQDVVEALERLGLRRNGFALSIIENLETGYSGLSRNATRTGAGGVEAAVAHSADARGDLEEAGGSKLRAVHGGAGVCHAAADLVRGALGSHASERAIRRASAAISSARVVAAGAAACGKSEAWASTDFETCRNVGASGATACAL